jgi:2-amino-4-hydroxy-6-hydroxymethyldihydropteridine diphosphokinase
VVIYVALGSNLGDRRATLERALRGLSRLGAPAHRRSSLYETAPIGIPSQRSFLNAVVELTWSGSPEALLDALHQVEHTLGRRRDHPDGDRTCDLDLLLFGDRRIDTPTLTVPHPGMATRRFVLEPLLELVPALADPTTGDPYAESLSAIEEQVCRAVFGPGSWGN